MAIPFVQPTEEDQELSNQQLQIMMALYMALQQVLRSRSFRHSSRNREFYAFQRLIQYWRIYYNYLNRINIS